MSDQKVHVFSLHVGQTSADDDDGFYLYKKWFSTLD